MMKNKDHTKPNKRRKRLLAGLVLTAVLAAVTGCSIEIESKPADTDIATEDNGFAASEGKTDQQALLKQFQTVVKGASEAPPIIAYLNAQIANADQITADTMLRGLHSYYDSNLEAAQKAFFTDNVQDVLLKEEWPITAQTAASIQDTTVRELVQSAFYGGYKLEMVEGSLYPIVDYSFQKRYSKFLSNQMKTFVELQAVESDKASAMDGGLMITWDELAERALLAEAFITEYKDSPERETVLNQYVNRYLTMYINGLINTPIHDFETFKLLDEVKDSYKKTAEEAPQTVTGNLVAQFLDVLASTGDQVFAVKDGKQLELPAVKQFREGLSAKAEGLLKQP
ncbi:hypothetical protein [Paenibacillus prosopidis]|uniref:Lipoprotein n=1 Tax=Paenibacillus prosopidis TaxID=630520 RepID=A0A368VK59_9BACL|nr:hypothetical protein [Paenibacillus prosopidis]RCW41783.1 hypothetical protein DFP97_12166 [Paenibacillus prosopidis]